jgi:hypothetical protein
MNVYNIYNLHILKIKQITKFNVINYNEPTKSTISNRNIKKHVFFCSKYVFLFFEMSFFVIT